MNRIERRIRPEKAAQHIPHGIPILAEFVIKQFMMKPGNIDFPTKIATFMRGFQQRHRLRNEGVMVPLKTSRFLIFMSRDIADIGRPFPN